MDSSQRYLFVSPWSGIIGPNIGLKQLVQEGLLRGHDISIICPEKDETISELENSGAMVYIEPRLRLIAKTKGLKNIIDQISKSINQYKVAMEGIKKSNADVVFINSENMLFAPFAAKIAGRPSAVMVHGARFAESGFISRLYFFIHKMSNTKYLAVSNFVAKHLCKLGVPPRRVEVVLNGVDLDVYYEANADISLRNSLNIPENNKIIGTVCHLTPRKGVHYLIEAIGELVKEIPDVTCLIVGSDVEGGAYEKYIREKIELLGIQNNIRILGLRTDVPDILRLIDVMIHPSETESFGYSIAEAMATGKPVVGFSVGAVPELIDHGITGFVAESFNVIDIAKYTESILKDKLLYAKMSDAALVKVKEFYCSKKNISHSWDVLELMKKKISVAGDV